MDRNRFLGIYLGKDSISIAEVDNKKLRGNTTLAFDSLAKKNPVAELDELVGLEALLKKGIKDISATTTEALISLSDTNAIFRVIEVPLMSRNELAGSLKFEIGSHLPFKIDEVYYDWKDKRVAKSKKLFVSFVSMKRNYIDTVVKAVESLGITVKGVEPSLVSLWRLASLDKGFQSSLKKVKRFAILDLSLAESNIVFCEDLPLFSRNIKVQINDKTASPDTIDYVRLKEELFMSFNFYNREFRDRALEKIFVFCDEVHRESVLAMNKEFAIPFEAISLKNLLPGENVSSYKIMKCYSASMKTSLQVPWGINLLPHKESAAAAGQVSEVGNKGEIITPMNIPIIVAGVAIGALLVGGSIFLTNQQRAQYSNNVRQGASNVQGEMRTLQNKYTQLKKGLSEMKATSSDMGSKRKISTLFAEIPSAMSDGMWLTSLSLSKDRTTQGYIVEVVGRIYLGDEYQEMKSLDMFINRLKSLSTAYALKDIKIVYTERKTESKDNEFMSFQIRGTGD